MDEEEDAFVYIFDRRSNSSGEKQKVHIGGVFSFEGFLEKITDVSEIYQHVECFVFSFVQT